MKHALALAFLVAGFVAATSPVWAVPVDSGLTFDPDPAYPGRTVDFRAPLTSAETGSGTCTASHLGRPPVVDSSCSFDPANFVTGYVVIPDGASIDVPYSIDVCADGCGGEIGGWGRNGAVEIVAPSATVPIVHCASYRGAEEQLQDRGLHLLPPAFGGPIGHVMPSGGSVVSSGSTVTPYPATVPTLKSLLYPSASRLVVLACATPSAVGLLEGRVASQSPLPGMPVPSERRITVYLTSTTTVSSSPTTTSAASTSTATSTPTTTATSGGGGHDGGGRGRHRPWWRRATWPTGSILGLGAAVVLGLRQWRIHQPPTPRAIQAKVRAHLRDSTYVCQPPRPGRLAPSFVLRHHTTYHLREPS